ncbi:MAG: flippase-like domain-containing protein [Bacteroidales bacterium]|nr:flippase-like domain-containing protein [Bacteroidales bacterium]
MNKKVSNTITYIVFLLLGILLLWLCFRKIDFSQVVDYIKTAKYSWMLLSLACLGISLFFRALRWNILIESMSYKTRVSTTYESVLIAYLANAVFPRLGEVTRCGTLAKKENIPFDKSFGTVVSERVVDLVVLFAMAILVVVFQWNLLGSLVTSWVNPLLEKISSNAILGTTIIVAVVLFIIAIVFIFRKQKHLISQNKWYKKIASLWSGFLDGIKSIFTMKRKGLFIIYTILIWGFYVIMTWLPFYMLPETSHLGLTEAITLLGLATLGFVAPVPGGMGVYHFIGILLLNGFYGISESAAVSFVTINHTTQMIFYLVTGCISYIIMFFLDRRPPVNEELGIRNC